MRWIGSTLDPFEYVTNFTGQGGQGGVINMRPVKPVETVPVIKGYINTTELKNSIEENSWVLFTGDSEDSVSDACESLSSTSQDS